MNRTYKVHFLGCKANQSDAYSYAGILQRAGWQEAYDESEPELLLVQTCTVTMSADAQARQIIRRLKREHPASKILVTGCYAQLAENRLARLPDVDFVIGNLNPRKMELLQQIAAAPVTERFPDFPLPTASPRTRVYLKLQDGCDARCSYCVIPSVRGKSRSLPVEEVLRRVEYYRDQGYHEMIFTGISLGAYGKDLTPRANLSGLMQKIDALPGNFKIRFSSLEPEEIDLEFIEVFLNSSRFQPHLHLPLQSGSDKVLKKMRRQYLFHHFDSIVSRIFAQKPDLNLGTDLLVGFPQEDREAFEETCRYFSNAPFAYAHVFPFSPRPGTPAADYPSAASHQEITERAAKLRHVGAEKNMRYRQRFIGQKRNALLLRRTTQAVTDNYIQVDLSKYAAHDDGFVPIRINKVEESKTFGTIIQQEVA
jgi:threonylcarbamoyladenosine tRNA methylthiotransferase MtaB